MTLRDQLRQFILSELNVKARPHLSDNYPLLETEAIDSLAVFAIVEFLESEFGIEIEEDDLVVENFASIEAMAGLVEARLNKLG